jgi:intracellular septation protein A
MSPSPSPSDPAVPADTRSQSRRLNPALRAMVMTLFFDVGLPLIAYFVAELLGASDYVALLTGTVVSGLRLLWVAVRQRRLDPFALFLLALFAGGLVLSFVTGDARFILAKDAAMSCTAGLVFLGSCIIRRPIAYYAAQRFARSAGAAQQEEFQATAKTDLMRARWYRVSLVWGIALLIDVSLRVAAIYLLPIRLAANISQILMLAVYTLLMLWTIYSAKKAQPAPPNLAAS